MEGGAPKGAVPQGVPNAGSPIRGVPKGVPKWGASKKRSQVGGVPKAGFPKEGPKRGCPKGVPPPKKTTHRGAPQKGGGAPAALAPRPRATHPMSQSMAGSRRPGRLPWAASSPSAPAHEVPAGPGGGSVPLGAAPLLAAGSRPRCGSVPVPRRPRPLRAATRAPGRPEVNTRRWHRPAAANPEAAPSSICCPRGHAGKCSPALPPSSHVPPLGEIAQFGRLFPKICAVGD